MRRTIILSVGLVLLTLTCRGARTSGLFQQRSVNFRCHSALRALILGIGQKCPKTTPISPYQGKMTC